MKRLAVLLSPKSFEYMDCEDITNEFGYEMSKRLKDEFVAIVYYEKTKKCYCVDRLTHLFFHTENSKAVIFDWYFNRGFETINNLRADTNKDFYAKDISHFLDFVDLCYEDMYKYKKCLFE